MKSIAIVALAACIPGFAQVQSNTEKQLTCSNSNYDGERGRHCEIREQSAASIGRLAVETDNGSLTIKGWNQSGVLVRARIDASAENEGAATALASKVWIDTSGGRVHANGPERSNGLSWSVSYEVFVPQTGDLDLKSKNGALNVSNVHGQIHFDLMNGAVKLNRVAGEVTGSTANGAIQVELDGSMPNARQMELKTRNGSVNVIMPASYSAHVQAETNLGAIQSDFPGAPAPLMEERRSRKQDFNIGAGGPLIHVTTGNGSIHFQRAQ